MDRYASAEWALRRSVFRREYAESVSHVPPFIQSDGRQEWRYNCGVPAAQPQKSPAPKRPIYSLETTGLLLIALLILILTLVRYWRHIPWGAR